LTSQHFSLSSLVSRFFKKLLAIEIMLVFFGSLAITTLRFDRNIVVAFTQYPGVPKIFIYPLLWYFCLYRTHAWDRSILYLSNDYYRRVFDASWKSLVAFAASAYLIHYDISRIWVIANSLGLLVLLLTNRYLLRMFIFRPLYGKISLTYLFIGSKEGQKQAINDFQSAYGFYPRVLRIAPPKGPHNDRWLEKYQSVARESDAYDAIIGVGEIQDASLLRRLADFNRSQIIDFVLATRISAITNRFEQLESPTLVRLRESTLVASGSVVKRFFDLIFSLIALVLISPFMLLIALIIKATSRGSILYVDQRIGRNGHLFTFPKFRSMYEGADKERLSVLGRPDEKMHDRYRNDPRITPFGRFMRRWSLDELPQFWCVLIGTMSVVGPRPILREELSQIPDEFQIRFLAKPGLTGLWQVTGRKEVPWNERMLRDIIYIDSWNLSFDLVLIGKTISSIINGKGAM
jgi:exopolysaccharide biosynthesis polyprenyl glycosylphosphotransferase